MSIQKRWGWLAPVAVSVALVVSGCGGSGTSKNDYVKSLNKAQAELTKQLTAIGGGISSDPSQMSAQLEKGGQAIDGAADDFNSISPPDDAASAHKKIVDGLHKLAGTFRDAAKSAKSNDLQAVAKVLTDVTTSEGAKELDDAQKELIANGYKFKNS